MNATPEVFVLWGSLLRREPRMQPWLETNGYHLELEIEAVF